MNVYYTGTESRRPDHALAIESYVRDDGPENYIADPKLASAVNVALILGKPLLVTGEPGTGKTKLAEHVAMALGLDRPERFDTKSTSQATDLFYRFDSLARFHSAQAQETDKRALDFITFAPLGLAILRTLPRDHPLFSALQLPYPESADHKGSGTYPRRSVVLIDEIDKAPRDFPNDLLDSIANLRFSIRELESALTTRLAAVCGSSDIGANKDLQPLVIITSNSEKNLPDAFLRRCVYFHIPFPDAAHLRAIVARRINSRGSTPSLTALDPTDLATRESIESDEAQPLLRSAVEFFEKLRDAGLRKQPSTAELIDWVRLLLDVKVTPAQSLTDVPHIVRASVGTLVKAKEDLDAIQDLLSSQFPEPKVDGSLR